MNIQWQRFEVRDLPEHEEFGMIASHYIAIPDTKYFKHLHKFCEINQILHSFLPLR